MPPARARPGSELWAVVRHADIVEASRHPEVYCSSLGISFEDFPVEIGQLTNSFLAMDEQVWPAACQ
jgi:cytochrome P450